MDDLTTGRRAARPRRGGAGTLSGRGAPPISPPALRVAFLGTPAAAVPTLRAVAGAGHEVAVVVTRPDARRTRRGRPEPSPVRAAAEEMGLAVAVDPSAVLDAGVELGVVVAYGRLIRPPVLGAVPLVNVHFSLLPRWRGAAPVERAVLAGDDRTGVCLMALEAGLDTGPVYRRWETAIGPTETAAELRDRLAAAGADLLVAALAEGLGDPEPQVGEPTYAAKLDPGELRLDWSAPAAVLDRVVRVGRAWTTWQGKRLIVWSARPEEGEGPGPSGRLDGTVVTTGHGVLRLLRVQPEGRPALDAADWRRGLRAGGPVVLG